MKRTILSGKEKDEEERVISFFFGLSLSKKVLLQRNVLSKVNYSLIVTDRIHVLSIPFSVFL